MARVFKFQENMLGTDIHTFMDMVNSGRPNKEIYMSGNKVRKNSMYPGEMIFICVNGELLYFCRAACVGPYFDGVIGETTFRLKDIERLDNPVRWSNHPELSNISGPAWTKLSDEQVDFIYNLQPAAELEEDVVEDEQAVEVEEMNVDEDLNGNALVSDDLVSDALEDGEEFFGTLLQRHQIDDIRQHLIMCEMSQLRAAMGRRMRELNQMSDQDILRVAIHF
jgi:hypothetical protein